MYTSFKDQQSQGLCYLAPGATTPGSVISHPPNGTFIRRREGESASIECAIFHSNQTQLITRWNFHDILNGQNYFIEDLVSDAEYGGTLIPEEYRLPHENLETFQDQLTISFSEILSDLNLECSAYDPFGGEFYYFGSVFPLEVYCKNSYLHLSL